MRSYKLAILLALLLAVGLASVASIQWHWPTERHAQTADVEALAARVSALELAPRDQEVGQAALEPFRREVNNMGVFIKSNTDLGTQAIERAEYGLTRLGDLETSVVAISDQLSELQSFASEPDEVRIGPGFTEAMLAVLAPLEEQVAAIGVELETVKKDLRHIDTKRINHRHCHATHSVLDFAKCIGDHPATINAESSH